MNVSVTPELEEFVNEKVRSGLYNSASEVVRESLRLLREQEELKKMRFNALRKDLQKGVDSLSRGEGKPLNIESIKTEGRKRLSQRRNEK